MASNPTYPNQRRSADPDGDIEFILDPEGKSSTLLVSSKVLSLNSPVFKALIRPYFQEGRALTASQLLGISSIQDNAYGSQNITQAAQPIQIPLPDDNAEGMTWLCHALHLRKFLNHEPDIAVLEQVTFLCKKYQCSEAIGVWTSTSLEQWNKTRDKPEDHGIKDHFRMLSIANALDDEAQFWKTCEDIVRFSVDADYPSSETLCDPNELGFQLLPVGTIDWLAARREKAISQITETIEEAVDPHINPKLTEREANYKGRQCKLDDPQHVCQRENHIAHYMTELARVGLWPLSKMASLGMGKIYDALCQYLAFEENMQYLYRKNLPDCRCGFYTMDSLIQKEAANCALFELKSG
ncbi:MAG: hypothetical protein Q9218_005860, partial [Villophora microphyllina]